MKILALEFSTSRRSAALVVDGTARATSMETGGRAAHAFDLIERALKEAGLEREQVDGIAVGLGPGSYTGIRAAIAVAQGWQFARHIKLMGIGSVPAMAMQAHEDGWRGRLNLVIDAQRGEYYLAVYELGPDGFSETAPLKLVPGAEIEALLNRGEAVAGPDVEGRLNGVRPLYPDAAFLGRLATEQNRFVSGEELVPIYLREAGFVKAPPPRIFHPTD